MRFSLFSWEIEKRFSPPIVCLCECVCVCVSVRHRSGGRNILHLMFWGHSSSPTVIYSDFCLITRMLLICGYRKMLQQRLCRWSPYKFSSFPIWKMATVDLRLPLKFSLMIFITAIKHKWFFLFVAFLDKVLLCLFNSFLVISQMCKFFPIFKINSSKWLSNPSLIVILSSRKKIV